MYGQKGSQQWKVVKRGGGVEWKEDEKVEAINENG